MCGIFVIIWDIKCSVSGRLKVIQGEDLLEWFKETNLFDGSISLCVL